MDTTTETTEQKIFVRIGNGKKIHPAIRYTDEQGSAVLLSCMCDRTKFGCGGMFVTQVHEATEATCTAHKKPRG